MKREIFNSTLHFFSFCLHAHTCSLKPLGSNFGSCFFHVCSCGPHVKHFGFPLEVSIMVQAWQAVELYTPPMACHLVCPHRKTILNSPNWSLNPTASHFLIKVRGETGLQWRGGCVTLLYSMWKNVQWFLPESCFALCEFDKNYPDNRDTLQWFNRM